jgi:hypothetical protein
LVILFQTSCLPLSGCQGERSQAPATHTKRDDTVTTDRSQGPATEPSVAPLTTERSQGPATETKRDDTVTTEHPPDEQADDSPSDYETIRGATYQEFGSRVEELVREAAAGVFVPTEVRVVPTIGWGCPCPHFVYLERSQDLLEGDFDDDNDGFLLPLFASDVVDATAYMPWSGVFRLRGHYTGERWGEREWTKARTGVARKREGTDWWKVPVFLVEEWCFEPPERELYVPISRLSDARLEDGLSPFLRSLLSNLFHLRFGDGFIDVLAGSSLEELLEWVVQVRSPTPGVYDALWLFQWREYVLAPIDELRADGGVLCGPAPATRPGPSAPEAGPK